MAIFKVEAVELWEPDRSAKRTGVPGNILPGLKGITSHQILGRKDTVSLAFVEQYEPIREFEIRPRDIVRLVAESGQIREYRVDNPDQEFSGLATPALQGSALWRDLQKWTVFRQYDSGRLDPSFSVVGRTAAQVLAEVMLSAPPWFVAGDVSGLSAERQAKRLYLTFDGHSTLEALQLIADELVCEWEVVYDQVNDRYEINLTDQVGIAGNRVVGFTSDSNVLARLQQKRQRNAQDYASRIVPILDDPDGDIPVGAALWNVDAGSGTANITLGGRPIAFDDQFTGYYFGDQVSGYHQITGSTAPDGLTLATSYAGTRGRFVVDGAGTWIKGIPTTVSPAYGDADRVVRRSGVAYENLVAEAGVSDDMETFSSGAAVGWNPVGTPAITQTADDRFLRVGSNTMRVVANAGEGIVSDPIPIGDATQLALWLSCGLESGMIRVEVVDANDTVYPTDQAAPFSNEPGRLLELEMEGVLNNLVTTARIRIISPQDGTIFHLDSATLVASAYPRAWEPIMGARAMWEDLELLIQEDGDSVFDELAGLTLDPSWIDLTARGSYSIDELEVGSVVTVRDGLKDDGSFHVNFQTRVIELRYDLLNPHEKSFKLERRRSDLVDFLTEVNNGREGLNPEPPRPIAKPRLLVDRQDGVDDVLLLLKAVPGASDDRLEAYTIFLDHSFGGGEWTRNVGGAFTEWQGDQAATYPHEATFLRPGTGSYEVRGYVQDNATGLRSNVAVVDIPSVAILFEIDPRQDGTDGHVDITISDPFLAVTSVEVAWKPATQDSYTNWAAEPTAPGAGESGTVGTDVDLFRTASAALNPKHNTHVKVRVGFTLQGQTFYVYESASFDINIQAKIEAAVAWVDSGGDAQGRATGDDDTNAIAWATSLVSHAAIDDAAFGAAIIAGDYDNARIVQALLLENVAEDATVYAKFRPFKGTDPADGTDGNGVDEEVIARRLTDTVLPILKVDKWEQAGYGYLQLEIYDPNNLVTEVRAYKAPGRDFDNSESPVVLSDLGGYYETTVELFDKHPSFIRYEIEIDNGNITSISDVVQFDWLHIANVVGKPELDWDPGTGGITAVGRVDEDAAAVAWAIVSALDNDYDAEFAAAISAGDFVNTGDRFSEVVASGVSYGDQRYIVFRPFAQALTTGSSATVGAGPDTETQIRIPDQTLLPSFEVEMDESGGNGYLYVTILDDPGGLVDEVQFRKAQGRNLLASDTWSTGNQSGAEWSEDVNLVEGHNSFIQYRIVLSGGYDAIYGDPVGFDPDTDPATAFNVIYDYDSGSKTYTVRLTWTGFADTKSVEIDPITPGGSNIVTNGRVNSATVYNGLSPGTTVQFSARGWSGSNATGTSGTWSDFAFELPDKAPGVDADDIFGLMDADNIIGAAQTWAYSGRFYVSGTTQRVYWDGGTLAYGNNNSTAISGSSVLLSSSSTYYIYFDPDSPGSDFQTTTSYSTAVSGNRFIVCLGFRASNTSEYSPTYVPAVGSMGERRQVSVDELNANVLTAVRANIAVLSALTIYTGALIVDDVITNDDVSPDFEISPGEGFTAYAGTGQNNKFSIKEGGSYRAHFWHNPGLNKTFIEANDLSGLEIDSQDDVTIISGLGGSGKVQITAIGDDLVLTAYNSSDWVRVEGKFEADNDVNFASGLFFLDYSLDRIGFNDLAPSYTFDFNGTARFQDQIRADGGIRFGDGSTQTTAGGGGGGDADTLDGLNSTQFARADAPDVITADWEITGDVDFNGPVRVFDDFDFQHNSSPGAPSSGYGRLYISSETWGVSQPGEVQKAAYYTNTWAPSSSSSAITKTHHLYLRIQGAWYRLAGQYIGT